MDEHRRAPVVQVLGVGSQHGTDAVGWLAVKALQDTGFTGRFPDGLVTLSICDSPAQLPLLAAGARLVIVVDALASAGEPGTVTRLDPQALARNAAPASSHDLGTVEMLLLLEAVHDCRTLLFGIGVGTAVATPGQPTGSQLVETALEPLRAALEGCIRSAPETGGASPDSTALYPGYSTTTPQP